MSQELVAIVAIVVALAILMAVALAINYPSRMVSHLTGGVYKPFEELVALSLLPAAFGAAGLAILVLIAIVLSHPFDLTTIARGEANAVAQSLVATPPAAVAKGSDTPAGAAAQTEGIALLKGKGCLACHAYGNEGSKAGPGSELSTFAERGKIAGVMDLNADNLAKWLANPPAVKPGTLMPNLGLSQAEIEKLVALLMKQ